MNIVSKNFAVCLYIKSVIYIFIILIILLKMSNVVAGEYIVPDSSDATFIQLTSDLPKVFVKVFEPQACKPHRYGLALAYIQKVFDRNDSKKTLVEKKLATGEDIILTFLHRSANMIDLKSCAMSVSFHPISNIHYRAHFYFKNNRCQIRVFRSESKELTEMNWVSDSTVKRTSLCLTEADYDSLGQIGIRYKAMKKLE